MDHLDGDLVLWLTRLGTLRGNGLTAEKVPHLGHRRNIRDQASVSKIMRVQRMKTYLIAAAKDFLKLTQNCPLK